jgi:NAD(P)-dependent dehydrogenase (short-subunit alcohol dehydrogenase family)
MTSDLSGKVSLVTGAGAGIGRSVALKLGDAGATVVAADKDIETARHTADLVGQAGGIAAAVYLDIAAEDQVQQVVANVIEQYGGLDCAVNNAAISPPPEPLISLTSSAFDAVMNVNLRGTWLCLREELAHMTVVGAGSIVNIGSTLAARPKPGIAAYAAAKAGVVVLTQVAAREAAASGVRVNAVSPGPTDTAMIAGMGPWREAVIEGVPLGRLGRPDEIAAAVLFLCSEESSYVTGTVIPVDGGEHV